METVICSGCVILACWLWWVSEWDSEINNEPLLIHKRQSVLLKHTFVVNVLI